MTNKRYLASACPPGQYIAQYGSGKGHNSGFSVQNRQVGVNSLKEISGVKLWLLTTSVLSIMKFFISSSDLTLLTYRRIKHSSVHVVNAKTCQISLKCLHFFHPHVCHACADALDTCMTSLSGSRQLERYLKKLLVFYGKTSK